MRRVGFRALKKALEALYTTKVNNRERTTDGRKLRCSATTGQAEMNLSEFLPQVSLIARARCRSKTLVPVEDLGCAWSLRPHKLFLVAVGR